MRKLRIILETLDTEEATYIWHLPKDKLQLRTTLLENGSPARGVIWVVNNGPDVSQSPVGTRCGYHAARDTHIASLRDSEKQLRHCFLPILRP